MRFSKNVASLVPSATLAIRARAKQMQAEGLSVIDLSAGEPSFPTPDPGIRSGVEYVSSGQAGYPPTQGTPELRAAVAAYVNDSVGHANVTPAEVLISNGVKQALFNISYCLFEAGDEILIPAPYWPTYLAIVELSGARPVIVPTSWESGFRLDVRELERHRTESTRGLFINSPANPSGGTYDQSLMEEICSWCAESDVWVVSDEIYRRLYYEGSTAPSVYDVEDRSGKVIHLDGVSKAFSMPGWRIGYAIGPESVIRKASALQSQTTSGAAGPSQRAAEAVLSSPDRDSIVAGFREILDRRRMTAVNALEGVPGLDVAPPPGAIYLYVRLRGETDSLAVAEALLTEAGVACVPGEPFGTPGFLRFNYAVADEELAEGLSRVAAFFS